MDLPPGCQNILDYVQGRGHLDDFSSATAEEATARLVAAPAPRNMEKYAREKDQPEPPADAAR